MLLQQVIDKKEVREEFMKRMKSDWKNIPDNFIPIFSLYKPYKVKELAQVEIVGALNNAKEKVSLKELNFLFNYSFVMDFAILLQEKENTNPNAIFITGKEEVPEMCKYLDLVDRQEVINLTYLFEKELDNYIQITGRSCLYSLLD